MKTLRDAVITLFTIPIWLPTILFLGFISFFMKDEIDPKEMKEFSELDFDGIDNDDEN
jgi:hypothetical protein